MCRRFRTYIHFGLVGLFVILSTACSGSKSKYIQGTQIPKTAMNQDILKRVEEYRTAVEGRDAAALLLMASPDYWEDSGTSRGEDDYGYEGLKSVLATRFQQVNSIRYSVRYKQVKLKNCQVEETCRAFVDLLVDASFTAEDARGARKRYDKRDQNQLVFERRDEKWLILRGM